MLCLQKTFKVKKERNKPKYPSSGKKSEAERRAITLVSFRLPVVNMTGMQKTTFQILPKLIISQYHINSTKYMSSN